MRAEQIFLLPKEECPAVGVATVYNNPNSLAEQGLIRKISAEGFSERCDSRVGRTTFEHKGFKKMTKETRAKPQPIQPAT